MTVSYSTLLRLNVITTGTEDGQWGDLTNTNIGTLLEQAIAASTTIDVSSGNVTLTVANGASDQSRCMALRVTGTPGTTRSVIAPAASKFYIVANGSDSSVVIKTSTSTGITIPSGNVYLVYFDTTLLDFVYVGASATTTNTPNKLVLRDASGNFAAGVITATTFSGDLNGTINTATTATTQSPGDNTTKVATTAFVTSALASGLQVVYPVGSIYTSTVSTNPATLFGFGTWVAFGAGRVLIGDGSGFTAGQTGGSKDAVVVAHTHTITDPGHFHTTIAGDTTGQDTIAAGYQTEKGAIMTSRVSDTKTTGISINSAGSSGTNANLQPYVVVYMWNRTA